MSLFKSILNLENLRDSAKAKNATELTSALDTALGVMKNLPSQSNIYTLVSEYFCDDRAKELSKIIFERIRNIEQPKIIHGPN